MGTILTPNSASLLPGNVTNFVISSPEGDGLSRFESVINDLPAGISVALSPNPWVSVGDGENCTATVSVDGSVSPQEVIIRLENGVDGYAEYVLTVAATTGQQESGIGAAFVNIGIVPSGVDIRVNVFCETGTPVVTDSEGNTYTFVPAALDVPAYWVATSVTGGSDFTVTVSKPGMLVQIGGITVSRL